MSTSNELISNLTSTGDVFYKSGRDQDFNVAVGSNKALYRATGLAAPSGVVNYPNLIPMKARCVYLICANLAINTSDGAVGIIKQYFQVNQQTLGGVVTVAAGPVAFISFTPGLGPAVTLTAGTNAINVAITATNPSTINYLCEFEVYCNRLF